ncbi:MAG: fibronectin type III domain-containing protein [Alistipes sp.]|nr:fibronectin type III domain-containing protein [Alistipes sp.]
MKKIFTLFAAAVIALMAVGCESKEPINTDQLPAPEFSANANENSITVSWTTVEGAAYYQIQLNDAEPVKTDKTVHRFDDLKWNTTYTVKLQAISAVAENSSVVATQEVVIGVRVVPAYREWCPQNGSTASAISNNGRWVVGSFDRQGMIIDLESDEISMIENFDCMDVADDGVIVGATYQDSQSGEAAMYVNGQVLKLDLSDLTESNMSSFQAVTPDGMFVVGWWWEYDAESYYGKIYDTIVPFVYDVLKDRITVLEPGDTLYGTGAVSPYGVSPDRRIVGCEQGYAMMAVVWEDEYSKFTYPVFEYDSEYRPTLSFGDTQVRMTPNGTYIYSVAKTYPEGGGEVVQPGCYNLETGELTIFGGKCFNGYVSAMTDDGIAFLNDVPFYMGTTSYVVDLKSGDTENQKPIIDWLLDEHSIDLYNYIQEGVIIIGASADGRKIIGIVNTDSGWVTFVIDLDGEAMPEL